MHSSYPLRKIAEAIEQSAPPDAPISIQDVSGSFSSGTQIKSFTGEIRPGLHPSVLKAIPFEVECGPVGKNMPCHLRAFDQAVTGELRDDGTGIVKVQGLDLSAYFKDLLQKEIQLEIALNNQDKESSFQIKSGSFILGKKHFAVLPTLLKGSEKDRSGQPVLVARAEGEGVTITYTLRDKASTGGVAEELSSEPVMSPDALMATLFFGKPFVELSAAEKEIVAERQ